jgi:hypothetical protein
MRGISMSCPVCSKEPINPILDEKTGLVFCNIHYLLVRDCAKKRYECRGYFYLNSNIDWYNGIADAIEIYSNERIEYMVKSIKDAFKESFDTFEKLMKKGIEDNEKGIA